MSLPRAVVFDLDGVLADVRHRLHHVATRPRNWDAFFASAPDDPVLPEGRRAVDAAALDHEVVYLTGRPERCRTDTESWLARHALPPGELLMRADGDRRPARLAKLAHLRSLSRRLGIVEILDDDPRVVETVRAAGYPARHIAWMSDQPSSSTSGLGSRSGPQEVLVDIQEDEGRT